MIGNIASRKFLSAIILLVFFLFSPPAPAEENKPKPIPDWIKNNADWWSEGTISEGQRSNPQNPNAGLSFGDGHAEIHQMKSGDVFRWFDETGVTHYLIYCSNTLVNISAAQVEGGCPGLTQSEVQKSRVYFRSGQQPDFY